MQMISEACLLMAYERQMIPTLVSKGLIGFLLTIKSRLVQESTEKLPACAVSIINLSQTIAKLLISTNPQLVPPESMFDSITCLVSLIKPDECHH